MQRVTQEMLRIWAERNGLEIQYMYGKCKAVCIGNGETVVPLGTKREVLNTIQAIENYKYMVLDMTEL